MGNYRITKTGVVHLVNWIRGSGTNDHIISTLCGRTDADAPFLSTPDEVTCKSCLKTAPRGRRHGTGESLPAPKTSEPKVGHDVLGGNRYVDHLIDMVSEMIDTPKTSAEGVRVTVGDRVYVTGEGAGTVTGIDPDALDNPNLMGIDVRIDADGIEVMACLGMLRPIVDAETVAVRAMLTGDNTDVDASVEMLVTMLPVPRGRELKASATVTADTAPAYYVPQWIGEAEKEAYATAADIHEACGRPIKDHCAYCDTCDCGCPVADTIASTDGGIHAECGKPLADHCTNCDECPRVPGPCWCLSTVDAEDDGRPVADEPVIIVTGSTAPGFEIDFGAEVTKREVTRREAWSIVKRLEYAGVHVPDRLGMVDEVMSGVASYPRTPAEWRHVERCGPTGHCSCPVPEMDAALTAVSPIYRVHGQGDRDHHLVSVDPVTVTLRPVDGGLDWTYVIGDVYRVDGVPLLTVADVAELMTPAEAASRLHIRERRWSRRRKVSKRGAKW